MILGVSQIVLSFLDLRVCFISIGQNVTIFHLPTFIVGNLCVILNPALDVTVLHQELGQLYSVQERLNVVDK